jgi:hypothetical protein
MDPTNDRTSRPDGVDAWSPDGADAVELCGCPECGLPAEVVPDARCGGAQMVGVRCVAKHWFFGLRDRLVA